MTFGFDCDTAQEKLEKSLEERQKKRDMKELKKEMKVRHLFAKLAFNYNLPLGGQTRLLRPNGRANLNYSSIFGKLAALDSSGTGSKLLLERSNGPKPPGGRDPTASNPRQRAGP